MDSFLKNMLQYTQPKMKIQIGAILFDLMKRITELYSEFGRHEVLVLYKHTEEAYPDLVSTFKELNRTVMAFEDTLDICLTPKERAKLSEWKYWDEGPVAIGKGSGDSSHLSPIAHCRMGSKVYSDFLGSQLRPKYRYLLQLCKKHGLSPLEKGGKFSSKA